METVVSASTSAANFRIVVVAVVIVVGILTGLDYSLGFLILIVFVSYEQSSK